MEVNSGAMTSFWFDRWSQLGVLINLIGERGCISLGIPINATVERAVQLYRKRRLRSSVLLQVEQEILKLKEQGLAHQDDICLWMRDNGDFKPGFMTSSTWNIIRQRAPTVSWSDLMHSLVHGWHDRVSTFLLRYCFQVVAYALWHERNIRRVGEPHQSAVRIKYFFG